VSSSVVKAQKVAVNVHALPESCSLCKLIDYAVVMPLKLFVLFFIYLHSAMMMNLMILVYHQLSAYFSLELNLLFLPDYSNIDL